MRGPCITSSAIRFRIVDWPEVAQLCRGVARAANDGLHCLVTGERLEPFDEEWGIRRDHFAKLRRCKASSWQLKLDQRRSPDGHAAVRDDESGQYPMRHGGVLRSNA